MRKAVSHVRADLVLFMRDPKNAGFLSETLRAAMREVQGFYKKVPEADSLPRPVSVTFEPKNADSLASPPVVEYKPPTINLHYLIPGSGDVSDYELDQMWVRVDAPSPHVDQAQVSQVVRDWNRADDKDLLVVITDQPIRPPKDWRYVIWDLTSSGFVVSTAPLDPVYWGDTSADDTARLSAVKQRARAALLSILGTALGLRRCSNPECYLFSNVESVVVLDDMQLIGDEHEASHLVGWGFDAASVGEVDNPTFFGAGTSP